MVVISENSNEAATNVFALMLNRVFSQYKDILCVTQTKCLQAENLFEMVKCIIIGLEEIGFQVLSILTNNNNAINKKKASSPKVSIVYPHPVMKSRPLFLLFDSVHMLKCIRDSWLHQKMQVNACCSQNFVMEILN